MIGFIYVIDGGADVVKVGFSVDPIRRVAALQTGSHETFTLVGAVKGTTYQESTLHRLLAPWRVRGEWFLKSAPAVAYLMEAVRNGREYKRIEQGESEQHPLSGVDQIIERFGGVSELARILGKKFPARISDWKRRGNIPGRDWARLVEAAKARGLHDITFEKIAESNQNTVRAAQ